MKDYSKLSGSDWSWLLRDQPELSEHVDWSKLNGYNWRLLLIDQPQFSIHADWTKLSGYDWYELITDQPQLCNTEELQSMAVSKSKTYLIC